MKGFCLEKVENKEATKESVEGVPEDRPQNQIQQNAPVHQHLCLESQAQKIFEFLKPRKAKSNGEVCCFASFVNEENNRETKEEIVEII